jgi:NAD(P)H dehydrogenase (quinone)
MLLVTGASGHVGGVAVRRLLAMGCDVAALARDTGKATRALPEGTQIRVADYDDPASLRQAFDGVTRLLFVSSDGDARDVMRHHANVINAAAAMGVDHVIFTSIIDIDATSPFYYTPVYRDAERRLAECGLAHTILRCGLYADFLFSLWVKPAISSGRLSLPVGDSPIAPVSRDDVAQAAATVAATPAHWGQIYEVTGPRTHSFEDIARLASQASGVSVRYRACSPSDYLRTLWKEVDDPWPHAFSTLCASIAQGRYAHVSDDVGALLTRSPEGLEEFFRRAFARYLG